MKFIETIKNKLGMGKVCPKHGIEYYYHGWDNLRACEECDKEHEARRKELEKQEWELFLAKHPEFKRNEGR